MTTKRRGKHGGDHRAGDGGVREGFGAVSADTFFEQVDDAIRKAADEHKARMQKLLAVIGEELALHTMPD